jgi:hypothetical protein
VGEVTRDLDRELHVRVIEVDASRGRAKRVSERHGDVSRTEGVFARSADPERERPPPNPISQLRCGSGDQLLQGGEPDADGLGDRVDPEQS